jgi:tetratricopeptide (TPR) repeat protein
MPVTTTRPQAASTGRGGKRPAASPSATPGPVLAQDILAGAQASRSVIQDFCPLAESLESELGQQYLGQRGNKAFISDASPVPFVVNNDGTLSRNTAEVFFASLQAAEKVEPLDDEIFVLELGIGVGLFARYFLDAFRDLCWQHGKDYYDRLCYIAADRSELMLRDVCRHGVLAGHPGRYRLRLVDALRPAAYLPADVAFRNHKGKPFRAVFLNYLPAAVLEIGDAGIKQVCVRTCLARNVKLDDFTELSAEVLAERARSADPAAKQDLLEVYGLFASEYDYRPVDVTRLPHGDFAVAFARNRTRRVLHSYGAIQCLERLLPLVHERGFILANDYGQTQLTAADEFEHQRFSLATFVGVNFPLLRAFFGEGKRCRWIEPYEEAGGIHARLLGTKVAGETEMRFQERFGKAAHDRLQEPLAKARECAKVGRFELAATFYQQALERQPSNWVVLNEVAMFLTFSLRDPKAGADMAKVALALNPTCSSELWNTLGDAMFEWGRWPEARSAYLRAIQINSSDVRARYNLDWVHAREKVFPEALAVLAEGLALDRMGEYRERLLQKQNEVLALQAQRHQQEYLRMINLVSKYASQLGQPRTGTDAAGATNPAVEAVRPNSGS